MIEERLGAVVVSLMVMALFGAALWAWVTIPAVNDSQTLAILVGALAAQFGNVVGYWVGSSAGSKSKDKLLLDAAPPP